MYAVFNNAVSSHKEIDFTRFCISQNLFPFRRRAKSAQIIYFNRKLFKSRYKIIIMLLRQDRRRNKEGNLLAVADDFKRRPESHFRFTVADISATDAPSDVPFPDRL